MSSPAGDIPRSEILARQWFSIVEQQAFDRLANLVHPSIVVVSKLRPGVVLEGKDEFMRFVRETLAESLYEAVTGRYRTIDESRVVVEGRVRWIDDARVIRDDPVTWAMEFEDGLLRRFVPARTLVEAETILASGRHQ